MGVCCDIKIMEILLRFVLYRDVRMQNSAALCKYVLILHTTTVSRGIFGLQSASLGMALYLFFGADPV